MKECLKKSWYKILVAVEEYDKADWSALGLGALVLVCSFVLPTNFAVINIFKKLLIVVAAIWGLIYISRIAYLWFRKRPIFDWLLVNGHFLRKVCCLVVLVPAVLTVGTSLIVKTSSELHTDFEQLHSNYNSLSSESVVNEGDYPDLLWLTYFHFIDPGNQDMALYHIDRVWVAIVSILGMLLLNGLLVSSLIGWFDRRREKWLKGETPYNKFLSTTDHYVIIGGSDVVAGIVNQLKGKGYIVIQTSRDVESFRRELFSTLKKEEAQRIIVRYGNRTSEKDIAELHIERAIEVYIIGEDTRTDDIESFHDTMNMECLDLVSKEAAKVEKFKDNNQLTCRVMFEYQTTFNILQLTDSSHRKVRFAPFNKHEMWAQKILVYPKLGGVLENYRYLPLEGVEGLKEGSEKFVHLVIVGMSRMGVAMAIEAAHLAHYANYKNRRTRITLIDSDMKNERNFFMGRFEELFKLSNWRYGSVEKGMLDWSESHSPSLDEYQHLGGDFLDIEWEFIDGGIEHRSVQQYLVSASSDSCAKLTIAICLTENSQAIAAAAYLSQEVYESINTQQVLVYQTMNDTLVRNINGNRYGNKLRAFGMNDECFDKSLLEKAQEIERSINYAYEHFTNRRLFNNPLSEEVLDSLTGGKYSKASEEEKCKIKKECEDAIQECKNIEQQEKTLKEKVEKQKHVLKQLKDEKENKSIAGLWSNYYQIFSMWSSLRCVGAVDLCKIEDAVKRGDNLGLMGRMEHNRWVIERLLMRCKPLTKDEQKMAQICTKDGSDKEKNAKKKKGKLLDICSNEVLVKVDCSVEGLDSYLIEQTVNEYKNWKTND